MRLYQFYGTAPAPIRKVIVALSRIARLGLRPFLGRIRLAGYIQVLNPNDNAALNLFAQREAYEKEYVSLFLSYVSCNPGGVILDIGANYGQYSLAVANIGRYGLVKAIFAFEPDSSVFRCLDESVRINGFSSFLFAKQVIISDQSGSGEILKSESSSLSNRTFITQSAAINISGRERCRMASVDEILKENNIIAYDRHVFMKIDIEGNEPKAFRGARNLLAQVDSFYIQFEYYPLAMREASEDLDEFRVVLSELRADTILVINGDGIKALTVAGLFALFDNLNANARPTIAQNIVLIKNCRHPDFVAELISGAGR